MCYLATLPTPFTERHDEEQVSILQIPLHPPYLHLIRCHPTRSERINRSGMGHLIVEVGHGTDNAPSAG